jgi:hypothetical protein
MLVDDLKMIVEGYVGVVLDTGEGRGGQAHSIYMNFQVSRKASRGTSKQPCPRDVR